MPTIQHGIDKFVPWFGEVVDRDDPEMLGRCKVRIFNYYDDVEEDYLPWAIPINPIQSSSLKEVGISPTGLEEGSWVCGYFADGTDMQLPIIWGSIPKKDDVAKLAQGENTVEKSPSGIEPASPYNAKYPHNKVTKTESGHVIEIDDTPDAERIHVFHKSGSYSEINHDGRRVQKIVGEDYEIVLENQQIEINGNVTLKIGKGYSVQVSGSTSISSGGTTSVRGSKVVIDANTVDIGGNTINIDGQQVNITGRTRINSKIQRGN